MFEVIITGATGFVGNHLVRRIHHEFDTSKVLCLIRKQDKPLERSGREIIARSGLKTKQVDLVSGKGLNNLPKSPKLIIHLAASTESFATDHRCNDIGTKNLLKALGPLGPKTHLIFTSTTAVMAGRPDCSLPLNELSPAVPTNEYGRTKLKAEEWLKEQCYKCRFRLTIVRLSTVFGPETRVNGLFDVLKKLIINNSFLVCLNYPGLTGLVHVDDVADALLMFSKNPLPPGKPELYILYSHSLALAQISEQMHSALGIPCHSIRLPKLFWKLCALGGKYSRCLEHFLPPRIYNLFWRGYLVVDDVLHCQSEKAFKKLPKWKPRKFSDSVAEVVS